jgi:hypothetical protein
MFSSEMQGGVEVERAAGGLVVVAVVHAARDGGVVVAEDRHPRRGPHDVGALVGRGAVAHHVAEAVEHVGRVSLEGVHHRREGLYIRVNVAEDAQTHRLVGRS